jgi:flagellar motility protein MotE (MotC chaperone)
MMVTRQRPKKIPWGRILLPVAAIGAFAFALWWTPSRTFLANGPLRPLFGAAGNAASTVGKPLSFAYQQQQLADRQREIRRLNDALEADRKSQEAKDERITALQAQVAQLESGPKPTPAAALARSATAGAGGTADPASAADPAGAAAAADPASSAADVKRTAAYWASMDAEKAAAIAQRLPDDEVNRIFAQMPPDAVGDIMNALPPKFAARLTQHAGAVATR